MGFFSWKTQDSGRSIANSSTDNHFPVIMTDDKGNQWHEPEYDGYGVFGGKDYYELFAEMNNLNVDRSDAITIALSGDNEKYIYPSLSECGAYYNGQEPENCEYQGYFYPSDEDDDQDEEDYWNSQEED
jgi:hypothetical protein